MISQGLGDRAARRLLALVEDAEACPECGWENGQHGQHLEGCEIGALHRELRALTPGTWAAAEWPPTWGKTGVDEWTAVHPDVTLVAWAATPGLGPGMWFWRAMKPGASEFARGEAPDRLSACNAAEAAGTPEKARAAKTTVVDREAATAIDDPEVLLRAACLERP